MTARVREPRSLRGSLLTRDAFDLALATERGIPRAGRPAEIAALRAAGARDLSLGRLFEGHLNGAQLVARFGSPAQRARAERDVLAGRLFGVWNTQDDDGLTLERAGGGYRLRGAKTWASGAQTVTRALVTATLSGGSAQLCLVPMETAGARVDASRWDPLGMAGSDSVRVSFEGVELGADDLVGAPGDYERQPWFFGGALRFVAVQAGALERLVDETLAYVLERGRDGDPHQRARAGRMRIAVAGAGQWLDAGLAAWSTFDAAETAEAAQRVVDVADMSRTAVERACLETLELALHSVGARGLVEPFPFSRLTRDLQMYLRQPAPDAVLARTGAAAFSALSARRSAAVASSTATGR